MNTLQTTTNDKDNTWVFPVLTECKKLWECKKLCIFLIYFFLQFSTSNWLVNMF